MKIELSTISTKKFLLITLLSIPLILLFSIGLAVLANSQWLVFLLIPFLGLAVYFGHRLSKTTTIIELNEGDHLKINDQEIAYHKIIGYFVNDTGLTQTALYLRLDTNKTVQITGSSLGNHRKAFQKVQEEILSTLKIKNNQLLELQYHDVYVRQAYILKPFIYIMVGIVIILDLIAIYLLVTGKMKLPWQILFVNFSLLGLIPYFKSRRSNLSLKTFKQ